MSKFLRDPKETSKESEQGKFEKFNLKENPFPSEPVVNKESEDKRINGDIYEPQIRIKEHRQFIENFVKKPQSDPNHIRLGYLIDASYIGRGNGKSAFLVNLQSDINREYCLDLSDEMNKCFGVYVTPEPGGRTKTFGKFIDLLFSSILNSNIINSCLATLRLKAISELEPEAEILKEEDENTLVKKLNSREWFESSDINSIDVHEHIFDNKDIKTLPEEFPLFLGRRTLTPYIITQKHFKDYYLNTLKRTNEKLEFVFSHLVRFFSASSFNGAYIFVDDFERIPDFQSARQKKDFALELRSALYDGIYSNAKLGFYNFILVLHAGVQRLISDAWAQSGMENRAPISPNTSARHIIHFGRLNQEHAILLIKKYLKEYRIDENSDKDDLFPFTKKAISTIGELSEYNAAKILKMAYELLEKVADSENVKKIDDKFVLDNKGSAESSSEKTDSSIDQTETTDLIKKALDDD